VSSQLEDTGSKQGADNVGEAADNPEPGETDGKFILGCGKEVSVAIRQA
jgi:hypothetical protein